MTAKKKIANAERQLDKARSKHDPEPDRVLVAILGWWASLESEVQQAFDLMENFTLVGSSDFRPGFEFLADIRKELHGVEDCLRHGRPMPSIRTIDELGKEIRGLLPNNHEVHTRCGRV